MEYPNDNKISQPNHEANNRKHIFSNRPSQNSNRRQRIMIGVLTFLLLASVDLAGFFIYKNKISHKNEHPMPKGSSTHTSEPIVSKPSEQSANDIIVVKENSNDKTKTDVYLKDPKTGQEKFYITLSNIYRSHHHNAEHHNGNLYVIHRTGGDSGYQTHPNRTDEPWR